MAILVIGNTNIAVLFHGFDSGVTHSTVVLFVFHQTSSTTTEDRVQPANKADLLIQGHYD